jgi:hypothetical protein
MSTLAHAARWVFTLLFGGALACLFAVVVLSAALFCIAGALVQGAWRDLARWR